MVQMGYKLCTSEVQIFLRYKSFQWGTVPPNGVQMAGLTPNYITPTPTHTLTPHQTIMMQLLAYFYF